MFQFFLRLSDTRGCERRDQLIVFFAGFAKPEVNASQPDIDALNEIDNIEAVRLDVTVQEDIDAAVETVAAGGHYSMTKHAIEAYTDSLAAEMEMVGVAVSVVEPGNYDSKIADSALRRMQSENAQYARDGSPFSERFDEWLDRDWDRSVYKPPNEVAEAVYQFFTTEEPLRRYMVVPTEEEAGRTINQIIRELVQLNEGQAYSYSRDDLIEMLDAAMAPPAAQAAAE